MTNILISEDDKYTRKMLEKIASENPFVKHTFTTEDGAEAVKVAQQKNIDIALLDIDMPNLNGIEAAKLINKISPKVRFIFITAHMEYAIDSFAVHPYDYLLKPVDIDELKETLNELIIQIADKSKKTTLDMITAINEEDTLMIPVKDIIFFQKVEKSTEAHTIKSKYIIKKSLTELENSLNSRFLRVHKSFIVNTDMIEKIQYIKNRSYCIKFKHTKKEAYMSRYKFEKLKETFTFN